MTSAEKKRQLLADIKIIRFNISKLEALEAERERISLEIGQQKVDLDVLIKKTLSRYETKKESPLGNFLNLFYQKLGEMEVQNDA